MSEAHSAQLKELKQTSGLLLNINRSPTMNEVRASTRENTPVLN